MIHTRKTVERRDRVIWRTPVHDDARRLHSIDFDFVSVPALDMNGAINVFELESSLRGQGIDLAPKLNLDPPSIKASPDTPKRRAI